MGDLGADERFSVEFAIATAANTNRESKTADGEENDIEDLHPLRESRQRYRSD
jgi:hypothetical protein